MPDAEINEITVDRTSHVEVIFADDKRCRFELVELRRTCPCATCRTARERNEETWPPQRQPDAELTIVDARLVGGYGVSVTWSDGHATGIYPFVALRRWCDEEQSDAAFPPDSGLPG